MTLITHFRNKKVSVIAGDSMRLTGSNKSYDSKKVCKVADGIIGYYGCAANKFYSFLSLSDEDDKTNYTVKDIIKLYQETIVNNNYNKPFSIIISTEKKSILFTRLNKFPYKIPPEQVDIDSNLKIILEKPVFLALLEQKILKLI